MHDLECKNAGWMPSQLAEHAFSVLYARLNPTTEQARCQNDRILGLQDLLLVLPSLRSPACKTKAFAVTTNLVWRFIDSDPCEELAFAAVDVLRTLVGVGEESSAYYPYIIQLCTTWATGRWPKSLRVKAFEVLDAIAELNRCCTCFPGVTDACARVLGPDGDVKSGSRVLIAALKTWKLWIYNYLPAETLLPLCKTMGTNQESIRWTGVVLCAVFDNDCRSPVLVLAKEHYAVRAALVDYFRTVLLQAQLPTVARQSLADALATLTQSDVAEEAKAVFRSALRQQPDLRTRLQKHLSALLKAASAPTLSDSHDAHVTRVTGYLGYIREVCEPLVFLDDLLPPVLQLCSMQLTGGSRDVFRDQHPMRVDATILAVDTELGVDDDDVPENSKQRVPLKADHHLVHTWLHSALSCSAQGHLVDELLRAFGAACDVDLLFQALVDDSGKELERAYAMAIWTEYASPSIAWTLLSHALDLCGRPTHARWQPLHACVSLFLLRAALRKLDALATDRAMCRMFVPLLCQLASSHMVTSHAAYGVLEDIHGVSCACAHHTVSCLLSRYGDVVINVLYMQLKFNVGARRQVDHLTLAVTAHMKGDKAALPCLTDIVKLLLRLDSDSTSCWVVQALAHIAAQVAAVVTDRRATQAGRPLSATPIAAPMLDKEPDPNTAEETNARKILPSPEESTSDDSPLLHYFASRGQWAPEAPNSRWKQSCNEDPTPRDDNALSTAPSLYDAERALALSILHRTKHHLADADLHVRLMAHTSIHRCIIILSTRLDALLPALVPVVEHLLRPISDPAVPEELRRASLAILRVMTHCSYVDDSAWLSCQIKGIIPALLNGGVSVAGSPQWHIALLALLRLWAEYDLLPTGTISDVARYGVRHVTDHAIGAYALLRTLGTHNAGMVRAVLSGKVDIARASDVPRQSRIPLTPWSTFPQEWKMS